MKVIIVGAGFAGAIAAGYLTTSLSGACVATARQYPSFTFERGARVSGLVRDAGNSVVGVQLGKLQTFGLSLVGGVNS